MVKIKLYRPEESCNFTVQLSDSPVHAGFPSPADDFIETRLDLNKALIRNPSSTFYAKVKGESMVGDGINDGDLLVIDKSVVPYNNCIAVCFLDGEFTLKRVAIKNNEISLIPSNPKFKPIIVTSDNEFLIWGVVSYVIKKIR